MPADVFALEILGTSGSEPTANILHYEQVSGTTLMENLSAIIDLFRTQNEDAYLACMPASYKLNGYKCRRVNNGGSPTMAVAVTGKTGTDATSDTNSDAASGACILGFYNSDPTAKFPAGHVVAGKIFMPAAALGQVIDSVLQAGYVSAVQAFATLLGTNLADAGQNYKWVIWSKTFNKTFGPFDVTVSAKVGIQRRRLLPSF